MAIQPLYFKFNSDASPPQGVAGLTVLTNVYRVTLSGGAVSLLVNEGACTDIGFGLYFYGLSNPDYRLYSYVAIANPTSTAGLSNADAEAVRDDFSLESLKATTTGRTLDVTATGGAGIDWANVENPTTTLNLSATTVGVVGSVSAIATDAISAAALSAAAVAEIQSGLALSATALSSLVWTNTKAGYIDVAISTRAEATGAGTGAYVVTATVTDGTDPLQNATLRVTEGATTFVATTDASGNAEFSLDAATYTVSVTKAGYTFTPTTRTVTGTEAGTLTNDIEMTAVTVAPAADPLMSVVYGYVRRIDGSIPSGLKLAIEPGGTGAVDASGLILDKYAVPLVVDADGYFEVTIYRNVAYAVTANGLRLDAAAFTPTTATYDLSTIIV